MSRRRAAGSVKDQQKSLTKFNAVEAELARSDGRDLPKVAIETPNITVTRSWEQAVRDMEALRLEDPTFERGVYIPAAGVPWFVTLFGRDTLVVSMQSISGYPEFAAGALRRLGSMLLTLIPFTPGGLGFVEAGLTGLLALAGTTAHQAVVATLAYRLASRRGSAPGTRKLCRDTTEPWLG